MCFKRTPDFWYYVYCCRICQLATLTPPHLPPTPRSICAGAPADDGVGMRDACQGDSGGPLVQARGGGGDGAAFELVGVTSFRFGCGKLPGIYTDVKGEGGREGGREGGAAIGRRIPDGTFKLASVTNLRK